MVDNPQRNSVLVVEDNAADAEFLISLVTRARPQTELTVVPDGEAAVARLVDPEAPVPDLVLLDVNLPRLSGHDVLARVRGDERCRYLPVVVLSTSDARADVTRALDLGASAYVVKPFGVDRAIAVLAATITFWLDVAALPAR